MTAVRAAFTLLGRAIHAIGNATFPITVEPDLWDEFDSHAESVIAAGFATDFAREGS